MSFSQGNIILTTLQKQSTSPPVLALDNGLHLDGTTGKLGGDLIENTLIPLDSFNLNFSNFAGENVLSLNPLTDVYKLGSLTKSQINIDGSASGIQAFIDGGRYLDLNKSNNTYQMGDLIGLDNGLLMSIENQVFKVQANVGINDRQLLIDIPNGDYIFGDIDAKEEGMQLRMDDTTGQTKIFDNYGDYLNLNNAHAGVNRLFQIGDITNGSKFQIINDSGYLTDVNDEDFLIITPLGNVTQLGGTTNQLGSFQTSADKGTFQFQNGVTSYRMLRMEGAGNFVQFGDIDGMGHGSFLMVHDPGQSLDFYNNLKRYLHINPGSAIYSMGDFDAALNGGKIELNDSASTIDLMANGVQGLHVQPQPGGLTDGAISTNNSDFWTFGHELAGAVTLNTGSYLQIFINTVPYKIALVT